MLVDEVHLLGEDRGSCLEAGVVGRIKMISRIHALANVRCCVLSGEHHHTSTSTESGGKRALCGGVRNGAQHQGYRRLAYSPPPRCVYVW